MASGTQIETDTPCAGCGHPYVRHTQKGEDGMAPYRKFMGCRECSCEQFVIPEEKLMVPNGLTNPGNILADICDNAAAA